MRKLLLDVTASLVATLIVSVGLSHVFPRSLGGSTAETPAAAQWAGNLTPAVAEPAAASEPVTSASYIVKADAALTATLKPVSRPCGDASCPPYKTTKLVMPPRRPAPEPVQAAPQTVAAVPDAAPAPAAKAGFFHAMNVSDHLPSTDRLLKPFTLVSDTVSHWVKRF